MTSKIVVGPIDKGIRTDRLPFNIDNDSFPVLTNAYQWRGRIKRKRGTSLLGRLQRYFDSTNISYNPSQTVITLTVGGVGFLLAGYGLESTGNIVPGSVVVTDTISSVIYTDAAKNGTLSPSGTIDYRTGRIQIVAAASHAISAQFLYNPTLPVMGLEDLVLLINQYPGTLAFDTTYSYNIQTVFPYGIYDVSFYKNPLTIPYAGYTPKTNLTPIWWNGKDYQQFWTTNYQGAFWTTNGINVPFTITNIGMQFAASSTISYVSNTATTITLTITNCPLVVGDFVFLNEWTTATPVNAQAINFQSGYVTSTSGMPASLTVVITLPNATLPSDTYIPGIIQYLTTRNDTTRDCIRWYDGDPTNGSATTPVLTGNKGWVNYCPPLSLALFSIADLPQDQYYLVGCRMIVPFKDRLLFLGPVVQTSALSPVPIYLQDTVIYTQNGTPYYTATFTGDPSLPNTVFSPILVPTNQTATAPAMWEDQTGFGGFITAGIDQPIITVGPNEDVLIVGFDRIQTRFVYTGNDIIPFNFFSINSEFGSSSTFSTIIMDQGVLSRGNRGYIITSQTQAQRIDLDIPDQAFEINLQNNGAERFCSQRDFANEWVYFTYNADNVSYIYPNQTLFYNYRDQSWGIFNETYTTYGQFRKQTGFTWATVGTVYPTWSSWNAPWDSSSSNLLQPDVIAGNQQGFILFREDGSTNESNSLYIQNISMGVVTCNNHCLNNGDFITISGALGNISTTVNNKIFSVLVVNANTLRLNPPLSSAVVSYFGGGMIKRMYIPFIQTKQFPVAWNLGRKTRIGTQRYLLTATAVSQITLQIYLSQDSVDAFNSPPIKNDSLIYSNILYTCVESSNLGLTPFNTNLQMISIINDTQTNASSPQQQIWNRVNTSLIGDSVQLGFTLSDAQMRAVDLNGNPISQFSEIELHGFVIDISQSQMLA